MVSLVAYSVGDSISVSKTIECRLTLRISKESTLNNVFSTVYGMVVVQLLLFLATACLQIDKIEQKRFERIEEKRGAKGGFV